MNASIINTKEMLYIIAKHCLELSLIEQMNVGIKLNLIDFNGYGLSQKMISKIVFVGAYKKNKIEELVKEIQKIKPHE